MSATDYHCWLLKEDPIFGIGRGLRVREAERDGEFIPLEELDYEDFVDHDGM